MTEGTNMICPSCGAFQPRAEICNKCGIIIAKASATVTSTPARKVSAPKSSKPPVAIIAIVTVVVVALIGYFLFSGSKTGNQPAATNTAQTKPAAKKSEIDRIGTFNSAAASNMHRTNVLSKLSQIRNALNMYGVDGNQPPGNDEGLKVLVDKGLLSQSDITDEWGNPFVYQLNMEKDPATGKDYTIKLFSSGPDGIPGNADDISQ